ncbi:MAG: nickel-responsive transcriptional regulator NikR [Synergistaceae bacterium]|jgi:CopG family nickel-responsive transcriptional regulator|nr:nickel-responsive transcriptional regulator NikR [Synergistaceae bacterium]
MTGKLVRFGVTVPEEIVEEFDRKLQQSGKKNRSDVLRQLMRGYIADERWRDVGGEVFGTMTMIYDHHSAHTCRDLTSVQHDHSEVILCTTHVHVAHDKCMECVILRGESQKIKTFVDTLRKIKGVKDIGFVISSGL